MKLLSFLGIAIAATFVSCTNMLDETEEKEVFETLTNSGLINNNKVRTPEEALQIACKALNRNNNLRLYNSADIQAYAGGHLSRSVDGESIYVINFDEGGFALVPALDKGIDVYGMSDTGKFVVNPDEDNDLGSYILTLASGINPGVPITPGIPVDSTDIVEQRIIVNHNGHQCYYDSITTREGNMNSFLLKTEWGVAEPYSAYTPIDDFWKIHCAVGCVPVAMGQIMAFHKYPKIHEKDSTKYVYNWNSILSQPSYTEETEDALNTALFLYSIADECNMNWGAWTSWASSTKPIYVFPKFGYTVSLFDWKSYDYERIKLQLKKRLPVYVDGRDLSGNSGGHAWVIDGYYHKQTVVRYTKVENNEVCEEDVVYDLPLVHCNWGNNGIDNGWFHSGVFNVSFGDYSGSVVTLMNISPKKSLGVS